MSAVSGVKFDIEFVGDFRYQEKADTPPNVPICAIDLPGSVEEFFATSTNVENEYRVADGRLYWNVPYREEGRQFIADPITLTSEYANRISFTARIFESNGDYFGFWRALDSISGSSLSIRRRDIPIAIVNQPHFEERESYLIRIENLGWKGITASFIKREETESIEEKEKKVRQFLDGLDVNELKSRIREHLKAREMLLDENFQANQVRNASEQDRIRKADEEHAYWLRRLIGALERKGIETKTSTFVPIFSDDASSELAGDDSSREGAEEVAAGKAASQIDSEMEQAVKMPPLDFEKLSILMKKFNTPQTASAIREYCEALLTHPLNRERLVALGLPMAFEAFKPHLKRLVDDVFPVLPNGPFASKEDFFDKLVSDVLPKLGPLLSEGLERAAELWYESELEFRLSIINELYAFLSDHDYDPSESELKQFYFAKILPKLAGQWKDRWLTVSLLPWGSSADPTFGKRMNEILERETFPLLGLSR